MFSFNRASGLFLLSGFFFWEFSLIEQPNEKISLNTWLFRGISLNSHCTNTLQKYEKARKQTSVSN